MTLRLGSLPEPADGPYAKLTPIHRLFAAGTEPPVPATYTQGGATRSWDMEGNDRYGDCVVADAAHTVRAWTEWSIGHGGVRMTLEQDLALYTAVTKAFPKHYPAPFNPDDPSTDNGLIPSDLLSYWYGQGIDDGQPAADFIDGFASLRTGADAVADIKAAIAWTGAAMIAVNLPQSAMDQFEAGQPWVVVENDGGNAGGHCVAGVEYDGVWIYVVTWAKRWPVSIDWLVKYMNAGFAAISQDAFRATTGANADGLDVAQVEAATQVAFQPVAEA
jgi:hypothetical protein